MLMEDDIDLDLTTSTLGRSSGRAVRKKSILSTPNDNGTTSSSTAARLKKSISTRELSGFNAGNSGSPNTSKRNVREPTSSSIAVGELVGIVDPNQSEMVILSIIEDPIQCGYLRTFCDSEHTSENLNFILEVIKFRELACYWDKLTWKQSWLDLDEEYLEDDVPVPADFNDLHPWPSRVVDRKLLEDQIDVLWTKFLSKAATTPVSLPAEVIVDLKKRLKMLNVYGPDVFSECVLEPLYALQRDALPRFLNSTTCTDMVIRVDSLRVNPSISALRVPPPSDSYLLTKNTDYFENDDKRFRLEDMLKDKILYYEFLAYLRSVQQSENLLCLRMIEQFEDIFTSMSTSKDLSKSWISCVTQAWNIFRYFVAPGAPYEVDMSNKYKRDIMLSLAKPNKAMFAELRKAAFTNLGVSFNDYKQTPEYPNLIVLMRNEKNKALSSTRLNIWSFFGFE